VTSAIRRALELEVDMAAAAAVVEEKH